MTNTIGLVIERFKSMSTPMPSVTDKGKYVLLGIFNCILFGVGMIIIGVMNNDAPDIVTGILQLCIPFVGWIWAIVWGILIVSRSL
ncbi:uncharacterized protein CMU_008900 [Cryptosporidium muris RN66]|uniref:Transmembrane protein n=1 Tax=Cryptosporidium muris (strain RN66) TaxID=441375 RepID=B6ADV7_CRYMR|nr:uncharacterized protein CMU_008900 [Cryptosporidium muris RN66]EEA06398.1 hypothetical protein, conserved [Cryptosporidium muris RN66]|eukprot:XP_002140747.1 hypothetical protein [Cryptosporidium muris RN66]